MSTTAPHRDRTDHADPTGRRSSLPVIVSAWAVPVLVIAQFAMVSVVPVLVVLIGVLRDPHLRTLRWWASALTAAYALPLALWAIGPERAPSLSKDMHPALAALVVAAGVAVAVAYHVLRRQSRPSGDDRTA
ncbi:hypothetical protein [Saccharothrix australiensis]|uniref:Uncharacterized protein n=1 Tax=Saccharothrix australiensis TaxID=2072 RepID=A0A495VYZ2_9PSEU|nr:hypothetical protein [Saccharothrix australiensis]RKT54642.1 hypothetical protein C8E97_3289 [Saccharothrix australiensis]